MAEQEWTVIVPLKPLAEGKSRLRGAIPGLPQDRLVLALATATITAITQARRVGRVIVVTGDPTAAAALHQRGADITDDPGGGLNTAIRAAAVAVTGPVAAMPADLPALRPEQLDAAFDAGSAYRRWFVADAARTGTVLLAAKAGHRLDPRFGPGSARAHARTGATAVPGDWPSLRQDVDTPEDLARALACGFTV